MHKFGREFSIAVMENKDGCVSERVRASTRYFATVIDGRVPGHSEARCFDTISGSSRCLSWRDREGVRRTVVSPKTTERRRHRRWGSRRRRKGKLARRTAAARPCGTAHPGMAI